MSSAHTKTGAVGILGLQAGEDVNPKDDVEALKWAFKAIPRT
jgi:hypothetical protein